MEDRSERLAVPGDKQCMVWRYRACCKKEERPTCSGRPQAAGMCVCLQMWNFSAVQLWLSDGRPVSCLLGHSLFILFLLLHIFLQETVSFSDKQYFCFNNGQKELNQSFTASIVYQLMRIKRILKMPTYKSFFRNWMISTCFPKSTRCQNMNLIKKDCQWTGPLSKESERLCHSLGFYFAQWCVKTNWTIDRRNVKFWWTRCCLIFRHGQKLKKYINPPQKQAATQEAPLSMWLLWGSDEGPCASTACVYSRYDNRSVTCY